MISLKLDLRWAGEHNQCQPCLRLFKRNHLGMTREKVEVEVGWEPTHPHNPAPPSFCFPSLHAEQYASDPRSAPRDSCGAQLYSSMSPCCLCQASVTRDRRSWVIGTLPVREGIQTWAQERLLRHNILWWFSFTFESPIKAPSVTEAHVPNTVKQSVCVNHRVVPALENRRKAQTPGATYLPFRTLFFVLQFPSPNNGQTLSRLSLSQKDTDPKR